MIVNRSIFVVLGAIVLSIPATVAAVTDCSRAQTNAEMLICSSSRLAAADEIMALAFREAIHRGSDPARLMESQRDWIRNVRDACNDVPCMLRAYEERTAELDSR